MFSTADTIVALATPRGRSAIGVVRLSGKDAHRIAAALLNRPGPLSPRLATLCHLAANVSIDPLMEATRDEVLATSFPAPASYTGEDMVEISCHGNPVILDAIVQRATRAGARLAGPGEFTLRAFLNGKRDLVRAEAVADLIAAATPLQARLAFDQLEGTLTRRITALDATLFDLIIRLEASLDFPDESYHFIEPDQIVESINQVATTLDDLLVDGQRGRVIREGARVVIAGRPNTGKSSLFNELSGAERAIVTDVAGTTRDLITERVDLEGLAVDLVDTAGWRVTTDRVEYEGVRRGEQARTTADLILVMLDSSVGIVEEDSALLDATAEHPRIVVAAKSDLEPSAGFPNDVEALRVSVRTGDGLSRLREDIVHRLCGRDTLREAASVSNMRHLELLRTARSAVAQALEAVTGGAAEEFVLEDLQGARLALDEIVGRRTSDDVLNAIFKQFCIGK